MANKKFVGSENRIVRIRNDEIFSMVVIVAEARDLPVQYVFDVLIEMIINKDSVDIDTLFRLSYKNDDVWD